MGLFTGGLFALFWIIQLAVAVYLLILATRFVNAVERIADRTGT